MKILVPIKRVIDYNVNVRVKKDQTGVETTNVKHSTNPFDDIAIEAALQMKEAGHAHEVVLVSIGCAACQESLRAGLAMGADRAILLEHNLFEHHEALDPIHVATILSTLARRENPGLIIMGKQAIDDDCNQTAQMLAGLLQWPQATFASQIDMNTDHAVVTREVDGGLETIRVTLPAVISTDLRLNEPRYTTLPNIMKAKKKPLDRMTLQELAVTLTPRTRTHKILSPTVRTAGIKVDSIAALMTLLTDKEKVLS